MSYLFRVGILLHKNYDFKFSTEGNSIIILLKRKKLALGRIVDVLFDYSTAVVLHA